LAARITSNGTAALATLGGPAEPQAVSAVTGGDKNGARGMVPRVREYVGHGRTPGEKENPKGFSFRESVAKSTAEEPIKYDGDREVAHQP